MVATQWIVPFKGRNTSLATKQNFLWKSGNVYIMDNHRAAMWCWLQEVRADETVFLLHIDEHFDTLNSRMEVWRRHLPELRGLSIDQYLALTFPDGDRTFPLIQWDNYLSLFLERYRQQLRRAIFITHNIGDRPQFEGALHPRPEDVPSNLGFYLNHPERVIVNVDLDYFFCDDDQDQRRLMFSDDYISAVFRSIRAHMDTGNVACLTLCLTPDEDYTGGWDQAEALCARACAILGIEFVLPKDVPKAH
ncbi:UPF0489 family protein [Pseudomonas aeruginosa]|nr:UPF0489 family protein [Pseudomonas aeruginosa]